MHTLCISIFQALLRTLPCRAPKCNPLVPLTRPQHTASVQHEAAMALPRTTARSSLGRSWTPHSPSSRTARTPRTGRAQATRSSVVARLVSVSLCAYARRDVIVQHDSNDKPKSASHTTRYGTYTMATYPEICYMTLCGHGRVAGPALEVRVWVCGLSPTPGIPHDYKPDDRYTVTITKDRIDFRSG